MYKKKGRKKKIPRRNIILAVIVLFALVFGLVANIMTTNRELTIFEKAIKDSVLIVENALTAPVRFINNAFSDRTSNRDIRNQFREMERRAERTDLIIAERDDLRRQIRELQSLLELNNSLSDYELVNATVINRNLGYWFDTITINKGERHGIVNGNAVIVDRGLVGRVTTTSLFTSTVRLLTTSSTLEKISVRIGDDANYVYGLLTRFDSRTGNYIIEGIAEHVDIANGALVSTTGMGDIFPSGILIGRVVGISTDHFDLAKIIEVRPDVDFNGLRYVSVLKRADS